MPTSKRPNILFLMGEDVGLHLGCYGHPYAKTPNLDRLAAQGATYTNAVCTAPVSAPSRSSVITGVYPWSLGTLAMRSSLLQPPRLFTHYLRDLGYFVNWHTKTDFNFEPPFPPCADPFCDVAQPWLEDLAGGRLPDRPWLLYENFAVTHESTMWDRSFGQDWDARRIRLELDHLLQPQQRHDPAQAPVPPYLPDTPEVRQNIAWYFDALSIQDTQVGLALDALERSGQADNTIVIYTSDHGRGLAREKRWCYDAGLHMPLIVRWPGHIKPGTMNEEIISWVDFAPTFMHLAGLPVAEIPARFQGRAFLGDHLAPPRTCAFAGRDRMDETYDFVRVARDGRFHYIRNKFPNLPYAQCNIYMERMLTTQVMRKMHAAGQLTGPAALWMSPTKPAEELYDWRHDPHMLHNLADDPRHAGDLARLRAELDQHLAQVGDKHEQPECELVAQGLVKDRMAEFRARVTPLPAEYRLGPDTPATTVYEMHEAQAHAQTLARK